MCGNNGQGSNWIRKHKRLAIYLRDGLACVYCGAGVEDGVTLTLDHLTPRCKGGDNSSTNLVTACLRCNSARGARSIASFCRAVVEYHDPAQDPERLRRRVHNAARRRIDIKHAKELIARRGYAAALEGKGD